MEPHFKPDRSHLAKRRRGGGVPGRRLVDRFDASAGECRDASDLARLLESAARELGFDYFALVHHASLEFPSNGLIRLDTYPESWVEVLLAEDLPSIDPVHQACRRTGVGFAWDQLAKFTHVAPRQRDMLCRARHHDIGNGFTVPIKLPGEPLGSCTFAVRCGSELPRERLLSAEQLGAHAFHFARTLFGFPKQTRRPHLYPRELQCIRLLGAGHKQREIATIMGISAETVYQYLKRARSLYGVSNTTQLIACALHDELISFAEAIPPSANARLH